MSRKQVYLKRKKKNRGQSFIEMSLLFMVVVVAILLMARYVKRASEGRVYSLIETGLGTGIYSDDVSITIVRNRDISINRTYEKVNNEIVLNEEVETRQNEYVRYEASI